MAETGGHLVRNIISVRETDLNALTNVGVYACEITDNTEQHAPFAGKALVEVYVYRTDDDIRYISQDIRGVDDFGRYTRTFDGSTWSAWQELAASEGGGGGTGTDLDLTRTGTSVTVRSNTGTDAVIPEADASNAGILSSTTFSQIGVMQSDLTAAMDKLSTIEEGATDDMSGAEIVQAINDELGSLDWQNDEPIAAADVSYSNTSSGLAASNVQAAIDEVAASVAAVATDLNVSRDNDSVTIESSTGDDADIPGASTSLAGVMSAVDKTKLDGISPGAQVNVPTHLSLTRNATTVTVASDTGDDAVIPSANSSQAGVMAAGDKQKLDTVETGATADQTGSEIVQAINTQLGSTDWQAGGGGGGPGNTNLTSSRDANTVTVLSDTGTDAILSGADGSNAGVMTAAQATKLAGIATGAQVNVPTNITIQRTSTQITVLSDTGDDGVVAAATLTMAGVMTAADKTKLDAIEAGATTDMTGAEIVGAIDTQLGGTGWRGNGVTHLSTTRTSTTVNVNSDTGNDAVLAAADASLAGVMTSAMFIKLNGIEAGATGDQTGAEIISLLNGSLGGTTWQQGSGTPYSHPNHTGDVTSVGDGTTSITDGAVVNSKLGALAVTEAKIANSAITTAKIATSAVDNTKLAEMGANTIKGRVSTSGDPQDLTSAQVRTMLNVADGANNYVHPNHSGDVTSVADGATTIAVNVVSNTKLADMAANTLKGRITSLGDPQDLTPAQVRTMLNVADGANAYTHPNHTGEVTSTGDGATVITNGAVVEARLGAGAVTETKLGASAVTEAKIGTGAVTETKLGASAVTNAKMANMAINTLKGRISSIGAPQDLTVAQVLTMLGIEAGATADLTGAEIVALINAALGGTSWQGGSGGSGSVVSSFLAKSNATQTFAHGSGSPTAAKVLFQTISRDPDGRFVASTTSRWTPGVAGQAEMKFSIRGSHAHSASAQWNGTLHVYKNGTAVQSWNSWEFAIYNSSLAAGGTYMCQGTYTDVCNATDYYEIWGACFAVTIGAGPTYYNGRFLAASSFSGFVIK